MFLVQVTVKDIPSRVDTLNQEQQLLKKSVTALTMQGNGDVKTLRATVSALTQQVLHVICLLFMSAVYHELRTLLLVD